MVKKRTWTTIGHGLIIILTFIVFGVLFPFPEKAGNGTTSLTTGGTTSLDSVRDKSLTTGGTVTTPISTEQREVGTTTTTYSEQSGTEEVEDTQPHTPSLHLGGETIILELAVSFKERQQGLSGRAGLEEGTGMFFIFENSGFHGFWMKDMHFAIDMLWLDEDFRVVHSEKNVTPETFPKTFYPAEPARYVLEVPAGFTDTHGITIGTQATFLEGQF